MVNPQLMGYDIKNGTTLNTTFWKKKKETIVRTKFSKVTSR